MTGTLTLDAADAAALDLSSEERWHVLLLHRGRPAARVDLASPGSATPALVSAAILRWADGEVARDELIERLRVRLGVAVAGGAGPRAALAPSGTAAALASRSPLGPPRAGPAARCSVVVCTHRRPDDLARLLEGLVQLDPAPAEIVVVDNDPVGDGCRAAVLAAGARYVREDRRGLNNARNAGIRAAHGDVVAFIDDDCVPSPGWLRRLPGEFANPAVGAVTGPAFPLLLDTPSRRRMERQASLARGLRRIEFDWTTFPVAGAGAIGVGANMAFRRSALVPLGDEPFPPELDAGTATESGGDTYVIAKLLARGQRVVYDPATFVYHRHREDARALHRAFFGYGVGLGAALTRLLVKDGELSAPATGLWLLGQYRRTQQRRLAGRADRVETRLAWDYIRGGAHGPGRWRRALAAARAADASASDARTAVSSGPPADQEALTADTSAAGKRDTPVLSIAGASGSPEADTPALSVIVPTCDRPRALDRCLGALAAQDVSADRFEVVVVDDSAGSDATIAPAWASRLRVRRVDTGAAGAAAARNAGAAAATAPLLLFLDDDVVAEADLVRRHLERHEAEGENAVVVGAYWPRPPTRTLAADAAALWWEDLFQALERTAAPTYVGALTGNMSMARAAFERSGGFDPRFGRYRREDWEWGVRAIEAGLRLCVEPAAGGRHEYALDTSTRLRAAELEGHGDALLLDRHPHAASAMLPLVADPTLLGGRRGGLERAAWACAPVRAAVHAALAVLERARLRLFWVRLFNAAQRLSYERGVRAAGLAAGGIEEPLLDVDLDGTEPIPAAVLAPATLRVRVAGREVARVRPALGQWTPELAEQIVSATPWQEVERAAAAIGCLPVRDEAHDHAARTDVIAAPSDWATAAATAAAGEGELVAITLPGVRPDPRWLDQALVAFDGSRVGAVVGRGLVDDAPPAPVVLHVHGDDDPELESAARPQYVILRRELLPALAVDLAGVDPVAPILALVADALAGGWVVAYRDVHGLAGAGPTAFEGARAATALHLRRSRRPSAAAGEQLRRATLTAAWRVARRRGLRAAAASYAGTLAGLTSQAAWRSATPRRFGRG